MAGGGVAPAAGGWRGAGDAGWGGCAAGVAGRSGGPGARSRGPGQGLAGVAGGAVADLAADNDRLVRRWRGCRHRAARRVIRWPIAAARGGCWRFQRLGLHGDQDPRRNTRGPVTTFTISGSRRWPMRWIIPIARLRSPPPTPAPTGCSRVPMPARPGPMGGSGTPRGAFAEPLLASKYMAQRRPDRRRFQGR